MRHVNLAQPSTASSETARHINRHIVLNIIRHRQPISRADVSRHSGLQRSTVSLITEELIGDGWVIESLSGDRPRGRKPVSLTLNRRRLVICVDIRPSEITFGVGDVNGAFTLHEVIPTPREPALALRQILERAQKLITDSDAVFEGIGISVPGRIDLKTHQLVFAPNLKWPITDLKGPLERKLGLAVELENAANACALSELWFGPPGPVRDLVAITISEGIGTGIIAHGQLITGRRGLAGEFGHVPLVADGPPCSCGNRGCWEVLASNRAALRYYFESGSKANQSDEAKFTFRELLALAEQGDVLANRALGRMAVQIGRGTRMIVAGLAPETITFIGEFTAAWNRYRPVIEAEVQAQSIAPEATVLRAAEDGATARMRGTMALVFQKHFGATASVLQ